MDIQEYKSIDDEIIEILASDETIDRDRDVIKAKGWQTDNWLKNGALLYGHDPSSPFNVLGSPVGAEVRGNKLYVQVRLAKMGTSPTHDAVRSLIEQKILKGVSVGFKSDDYEPNEHGGRTFKSQELLELSVVPVPANPSAKMLLKSYGQEVEDLLLIGQDNIKEETQVVEPNFISLIGKHLLKGE
jgi:HK97 family phage prohead protease